jgi:hypothetical protein
MMASIRVQIAEASPMFGSMITGLLGDVDGIELVSGTSGRTGEPVDVMLISEASKESSQLLFNRIAEAAPMGVVSIAADGRHGASYRILKKPIHFSSNSSHDLIGAIRVAAGRA